MTSSFLLSCFPLQLWYVFCWPWWSALGSMLSLPASQRTTSQRVSSWVWFSASYCKSSYSLSIFSISSAILIFCLLLVAEYTPPTSTLTLSPPQKATGLIWLQFKKQLLHEEGEKNFLGVVRLDVDVDVGLCEFCAKHWLDFQLEEPQQLWLEFFEVLVADRSTLTGNKKQATSHLMKSYSIPRVKVEGYSRRLPSWNIRSPQTHWDSSNYHWLHSTLLLGKKVSERIWPRIGDAAFFN